MWVRHLNRSQLSNGPVSCGVSWVSLWYLSEGRSQGLRTTSRASGTECEWCLMSSCRLLGDISQVVSEPLLGVSPAKWSEFFHGSLVYQETQVEAAGFLMPWPQNLWPSTAFCWSSKSPRPARFKGWRIRPQVSMGQVAKNFQPSPIYHIPFGHKHYHMQYSLPPKAPQIS